MHVLIVTYKRGRRRKKEKEEKAQFGEPRREGEELALLGLGSGVSKKGEREKRYFACLSRILKVEVAYGHRAHAS
ncbi:hypothetical protein NC653_037938 [Populus alba x Populus x berolinensis]|uniref:Uncharacterized protein n=1 Tax=Populus alba x Populus x berolinensis TaxID=444605 RepID=A0AAD6LH05_9ROSI|nr:hypothetical protein NC653_037938 [Populus alba x Populus x berolinensis]